MKKIAALILITALILAFFIFFAPYTQNTELYTPENTKGTFDNFNPDALKQTASEKSEETLSLMQDFIDLSGTIILNIRYDRIEDAYEDIEEYKNYLSKYDNLLINLDMTKSEIDEFRRNNKEQLANLEELASQIEELDNLEKIQVQYRDSGDSENYYSVTYDIAGLRKDIAKTKEELRISTQKTIESGSKYNLETKSLETSSQEIESIGSSRPDNIATLPEKDGNKKIQEPKTTYSPIESSPSPGKTEIQENELPTKPSAPENTLASGSQEMPENKELGPLEYINTLIKNVLLIFASDDDTKNEGAESYLMPAAALIIIIIAAAGYMQYKKGNPFSKNIFKNQSFTENRFYPANIETAGTEKIIKEYSRLKSLGKDNQAFKILVRNILYRVSLREMISYSPSVTNNEFLAKISATGKNNLKEFILLYEKIVYSANPSFEEKEKTYELFISLCGLYGGDEI